VKKTERKYLQPFSSGGCYVEGGMKKIAIFDQSIFILKTIKRMTEDECDLSNGAISKFQWPWMTPRPDLKDTPFFDVEYLRNGTR